jgi:predicted GNAT family acetyltransferase
MLIQNKAEGGKGMFYVEVDGEVEARLFYHMTSPSHMVLEHTEVNEALRGQNIGFELVHTAVDYARLHNIKITVWCPFAKKVFDKKPDFHDVLAIPED